MLADPLEDTRGIGALGYLLAAGFVALVALPFLEASARGALPRLRPSRRQRARLVHASAVIGAAISGGVAGAGLAGGFEFGSVLVFAGGLVAVLAADL